MASLVETSRTTPPRTRDITRNVVVFLVTFAVFVAAWEGFLRVLDISAILVPSPSSVVGALHTSLTTRPTGPGSYLSGAVSTYAAAISGFAIASVAGVLVAIVLAQSLTLERILVPYIVGFQTLPRIAIAPLFIIWFGNETESKIILATLVAFFPVLMNSLAGFKSTPPERIEYLRTLGATRFQLFWRLQLPGATPYVFAGLEVAMVFAILGVIVSEFVGGRRGLGVLILQSHYAIDVAGVFSVFVILIVIGLTLRMLLVGARKRLAFWAEGEDSAAL